MTDASACRNGPLPPIVAGLLLSAAAHAGIFVAAYLLVGPGGGQRGQGGQTSVRVRLTMPQDRSALDFAPPAPVIETQAMRPSAERDAARPTPVRIAPKQRALTATSLAHEMTVDTPVERPAPQSAPASALAPPPSLALLDPDLPMQAPPDPSPPTPSRPIAAAPAGSAAAGVVEQWQPQYPPRARRAGQQGTVLVAVEVLENGSSGAVRLHSSSGHQILDDAAMLAAARCRFRPARRLGVPYRSTIVVPFVFQLR